MKKKIAIIFPKDSSAFFDNKSMETFGGATVQMFLLSKEFNTYDDVIVSSLVTDFGQKNECIIEGLNLYKTFCKKDNLLIKIIKFHKVIHKVRPDVIIQRGLTIFSCFLAVYCRVFKIKFIYMFASDVESAGYYQSNHKRAPLFKLLTSCADILITQNQYQHDKILHLFNRNTDILYNSFPINNSSNDKKDFILWVGRAEKLKQPEKFIKLASSNIGYKFVMICNKAVGQEDYFFLIQNLAKKIENLEFVPYVPFGKIEAYFQKAKIFVNTSDYEGFPNTFIQAGIGKTPILSLNVNPDNFITKYNCGIYCDGNEKIMNTSIQKLIEDSNMYSLLSENAHQFAEKNYDIKKNAKHLYELIFRRLRGKHRKINFFSEQ